MSDRPKSAVGGGMSDQKMSPVYLLLIPWIVYLTHWPLQPVDEMQAVALAPLGWQIICDVRLTIKNWLDYREGRAAARSAAELLRKGS